MHGMRATALPGAALRAAVLGCGLTLLAVTGCSGSGAERPPRPSWPPGAYIGPSWPRAVYVFLSSPRPEGDVRAALASADEVVASAGRYLPTRDFSLLLPNPRDEALIANPTIRMLRLLAYARARSPAPVWLVGSQQDIDLVLHGVPSIPARAFAGFVLLPMTPDDCGGEAEMHEQGLDGMPTVLVGLGSAACLPRSPGGIARSSPAPITTPPFGAPGNGGPENGLPEDGGPENGAPENGAPGPGAPPAMALAPAAPPPAAPSAPQAAPPAEAPSAALPATPLPVPPVAPPAPRGPTLAAPALPPNMPFQKLPPASSGNPVLKTAPKPPVTTQPLPAPEITPPAPPPAAAGSIAT